MSSGRLAVRLIACLLAAALAAVVLAACGEDGPPGPRVLRDMSYEGDRGRSYGVDVFVPGGEETPRPAVLLLHGGTWRGGDRTMMEDLAEAAQAAGFVAVTADYGLEAQPAFPSELRDVQAAIRWIRDSAEELGVDPTRVGALGVSAGGHLAALAATVGSGPPTEGGRPGAVVSWSGPMNLAAIAVYAPPPSAVCHPPACLDAPVWNLVLAGVLGCPVTVCPDRYLAFSPVTHVSPDDPPIMLVNSVGDLIVPFGQAEAMAARLQLAGVPNRLLPVLGNLHGGYDDTALEPSLAFLRTELDRVAAAA